jgi:hypothetical protein
MSGFDNIVKLPLWRECAKEMIQSGISHGETYPASYFEEWLKCKSDSMAFSLGIAEIRRALEMHGFYLSGRGQKGTQFVIVPAEAHANVMRSYSRKAADALKRGVILGTNTRLDHLQPDARRRHESMLEKMAVKFALLSRSGQVADALPESSKGLLKKPA